ncbi:MAG: PAS domain S-box protein, partial [Nitrospirae bacterium]
AKRIRAIFEQAPLGIAVINSHSGQFLEINSKYCEMTGFSENEMLRHTFQDITHPEDLQADLNNMKLLLEGKIESFEMDKRYIRKDNSIVWVHLTVVPLWWGAEHPRLHIAMVDDITKRKRAEEAATLFRSLVEHTNDGIEVIDPKTGRFLDVNEKACLAHGYTRDEYLSLTVLEIDPLVATQGWEKTMDENRRCGSRVLDTLHRRKDGSVFPVEVNVTYIRLDRDYLLAVVRDISERKQAEAALRESEQQLRLFTLTTNDSTWNWDLVANHVMRSGFERAFGYLTEEVAPGIDWWVERLHPDDRERVMSTYQDAVARGSVTCSYEYRFRRRDGAYAMIDDRAYIVYDGTGRPVRMLGAMTDITRRKQDEETLRKSEQQLRQLFEDRDRMARDLHDNIIQALYAVGMGLEECQRLIRKNSALAVRMAGDAVTSLNAVMRDVRQYIKGLEPQFLSGRQLRVELAELVRTMEAPHLLRFRLSVDPAAAASLTSEEANHVLCVVREAMSNSLRHSHAKTGAVSLLQLNGHIRLEVVDDGTGFDMHTDGERGEGLHNMTARAQELGARLEVVAQRGEGVRVLLDIPRDREHV